SGPDHSRAAPGNRRRREADLSAARPTCHAHRSPALMCYSPPRATESHDRCERVTVGHRQCSQPGMVRTVDFAFSDEQLAIRNTARAFIADEIITREAEA